MAIDRDEMIRTAALNLLRIAEALEQSEAPEAPEAEEAVETTPEAAVAVQFKCDGCDHAIGLDEINAKNKEFAGDVDVDPIAATDKIRCPECGKGIMAVVEAPEAPEGDEGAEALPDGDDDADEAAEDTDLTDKAEQPPTAVEGPGLTGHPAEANPMAQPLVVEAPAAAVAVEAPAAVAAVVEDDEHEEKETPEEEAAEHSREAFMQAVRMASLSIEI
jgi:DNA-directed RNA polymerase subunit RPC12/RpoP